MADRTGIVRQPGVSLSAATLLTVMQLQAAANHAIKVVEIGVGFNGTNPTAQPVLVELARQTGGTFTGSLTVVHDDEDLAGSYTFDTAAEHTATVEPTNDKFVRHWRIHPQHQLIFIPRKPILLNPSNRLGLIMTAAEAVAATAYMLFEE